MCVLLYHDDIILLNPHSCAVRKLLLKAKNLNSRAGGVPQPQVLQRGKALCLKNGLVTPSTLSSEVLWPSR